jgi:hypothetical protein
MNRWRVWLGAAGAIIIGASIGSLALAYPTGNYGSGTYGWCEYGTVCSITLVSDGNITLNVTPTSGGSCTIHSDTASVQTDDTNGYVLTLADTTTNTSLVNGSHSITAGSGTLASPAALTSNSWGWRVDSLGSFGSGPTTAQDNVSPDSTSFAAIQSSSDTPDTIATSSTAADPAVVTTVWYGECANTSVVSGSYATTVTYTAVAN